MKDNKQRLLEVMGKLDSSFKPKINETWTDGTNYSVDDMVDNRPFQHKEQNPNDYPEDPSHNPTEEQYSITIPAVDDRFKKFLNTVPRIVDTTPPMATGTKTFSGPENVMKKALKQWSNEYDEYDYEVGNGQGLQEDVDTDDIEGSSGILIHMGNTIPIVFAGATPIGNDMFVKVATQDQPEKKINVPLTSELYQRLISGIETEVTFGNGSTGSLTLNKQYVRDLQEEKPFSSMDLPSVPTQEFIKLQFNKQELIHLLDGLVKSSSDFENHLSQNGQMQSRQSEMALVNQLKLKLENALKSI